MVQVGRSNGLTSDLIGGASDLIQDVGEGDLVTDAEAGMSREAGSNEAWRGEPTEKSSTVSGGDESVGVLACQFVDRPLGRRSDRLRSDLGDDHRTLTQAGAAASTWLCQ